MSLSASQQKKLVAEYKKNYVGDAEITIKKVIDDLKAYVQDFTAYSDIDEVPFKDLIDFIG